MRSESIPNKFAEKNVLLSLRDNDRQENYKLLNQDISNALKDDEVFSFRKKLKKALDSQ